MRTVNTTERNMLQTPAPNRPAVNRYHLTDQSKAILAERSRQIRARLAERRAQRQTLDLLATMRRGRA